MHRERPLDFWLTMVMVAALFVPIWGVLLAPSGLIRVNVYIQTVGVAAGIFVVGTLVYARLRNRVLLNRFLVGYLAGFLGSLVVHLSMLVARSMGVEPDLTGTLGRLMLGLPLSAPVTPAVVAAGLIYHYLLNGAAWGAVYGLVFGKVPWWIGVIFGLGIAAILLITPSFYLFGFSEAGAARGPLLLLLIAIVHIVYGGVIGIIVYRYVFPEVGVEGAKAIKPTYA